MAEPAAPAGAAPSRTVRTVRALDRLAARRWFLPATAVFPLADYALPVLPNQVLLATLSALHPGRWRALAVTFVLAAGAGALLVTTAVQATGGWLLDALPGDPAALAGVLGTVRRAGLPFLAALSLLPWPPRTAVLACALAGLHPASIAAVVMAGRSVPVGVMAHLGARAPRLLRRWARIDRVLSAARPAGGPHRHARG